MAATGGWTLRIARLELLEEAQKLLHLLEANRFFL